MHPRQLRQITATVLTVLGLEAVMLYLGRGSALWRELLFPLHFVLGAWVLYSVWSALRERGARADRRQRERRRQAPGGA